MKINFVGDFVVNDSLPVICPNLKSVLGSGDYNIINFEAPIHSNCAKSGKSGPSISQNTENPQWLKDNGFNVISLANNHIFDYGIEGFNRTKQAFGDTSIVGAGSWEDAYKPLVLKQDGLKIGILALGELQFGYLHDNWTQQKEIGCAWINHPCVNRLVIDTKNQVDYLILIAHAGLEMETIPLPEWRDRYRELIDLGCDAIIGGHTHTPQGYDVYKGKPIFYSLGNFFFSSLDGFASKWWNIGELVSISITASGLQYQVYGVDNEKGTVELIGDSKWRAIVGDLNSQLADANYMHCVEELCMRQMTDYWALFNMGGLIHPDKELVKSVARQILNKYDHIHLLNLFQCESHRWCISRAIKLEM